MQQQTFRAAPGSYIILVGLLCVPAIIWIVVMLQRHAWEAQTLLITLALPVTVAAWLASLRLDVSEAGIRYRSMPGRSRFVSFSEIESITVAHKGPLSSAPLGIKVKLRNGDQFVVNMKPFPIDAARVLLGARGR